MRSFLLSKLSCPIAAVVLAAQANVYAQTFNPIALTTNSFTQCCVVPSNWPYRMNSQAVTVTIDNGPSLAANSESPFPTYYSIESGDTFFEIGLDWASTTTSNTYGMPHGGAFLTNVTTSNWGPGALHYYVMPYWTNYNSNCCFLGNFTSGGTYNGNPLTETGYVGQTYTSANLALNTTSNFTALSLLCSGGGSPSTFSVAISYADGTTQTRAGVGTPNWFTTTATNTTVTPNATFAYTCLARMTPVYGAPAFASTGVTSGTRLYSVDLGLNDTNSAPTNILFTYTTTTNVVIFAVSGSTNANDANSANTGPLTGPFTPIPVSGFNAGCVVAAPIVTRFAPITATMDGGTNIISTGAGVNTTWLEKGYDLAAPTNGFPPHGTIIASHANTNRFYQMAPSYFGPMSTLVDTNHQKSNITPQTPAYYTAISLLVCGANIGGTGVMTNLLVLQHADGVNETNQFFCYDWFNDTQPYAWACNERVSLSGGTPGITPNNLDNANLDLNPRLFESEFVTVDGTAITNIVALYSKAPGATSTTFILGISGTTNEIAISYGTNTIAQDAYAGGSASFTATATLGSFVYDQWYYVNPSMTVTQMLTNGLTANGSKISGATVPNGLVSTMTISNISPKDAGYYYCTLTNADSSFSTPLIPLCLLTSTNSVLNMPGSSVTTPSGYLPSATSVSYASDGTLEPYLNFGPGGAGNVWLGADYGEPVALDIVPSTVGYTILTAARIYASTNPIVADPADFTVYGSVDNMNWTLIDYTLLSMPAATNANTTAAINTSNQVLQEIDFANTNFYLYYEVFMTNTVGGDSSDTFGLEFAELQLLGYPAPAPPLWVTQPSTTPVPVQVGGNSGQWMAVAGGAGPITYQWYSIISGATNLISGAVSTNFGITNAQLTNSGQYYCVASNPYGAITSTVATLNVGKSAGAYATTILADNPVAYWPLDENPDNGAGNNGAIAFDVANGHDGYYSNSVIGVMPNTSPSSGFVINTPFGLADSDTYYAEFGQIVDPAVGALADNYVAGINGINFGTPTNTATNLSVEAWVYLNADSTAGAGIVAQGYGAGGEQFALDLGGGANAFRFYWRDAGGATHGNASPSGPPALYTWYHVVGVLCEVSNYVEIFTNGVLAQSNSFSTGGLAGLLQEVYPISIGARQPGSGEDFSQQLSGSVADVAIYAYPLSPAQVANHYLVSGILPAFTEQPTNTSVGDGGSVTFYSAALGTLPVGYQWFDNTLSQAIPNATNSYYTITHASYNNLNNEQYYVVASNSYGATTSSIVTLSVIGGAPQIAVDLQPGYSVSFGAPLTLSASFLGTTPISYQWLFNGTPLPPSARFSGFTSNALTIFPTFVGDSGTYQIYASNAFGTNYSSMASVTVLPYLTFSTLGSGWSYNVNTEAPFGGYIASNVLELTDGNGDEAISSFSSNQLYIGNFAASFTYTVTGGAGADGMTFVLQDDPRGPGALGVDGGALGYSSGSTDYSESPAISPSVALEFNLYTGATPFEDEANEISLNTNGFLGDTGTGLLDYTSPVFFNSGDPINVSITYSNNTASLLLTDANTAETFSVNIPINIPAVLRSNLAYVGFTGGDGGSTSIQQISNFSFTNFVSTSFVTISAATSGTNLVLSWPAVAGYQLQSIGDLSRSANPAAWQNVSAAVITTNGNSEVLIPFPAHPQFYRLESQ